MVFHPERHADQQAGDEQRGPAAFIKFHDAERDENAAGEQQAKAVDENFAFPVRFLRAFVPPVPHHAELREAEGDEDVDAVKHDEHVAPRRGVPTDTTSSAAAAHEQHAVLRDQPVAQRGEPRGHPAVHRHVGQHARAAEKSRLRGDEQQRGRGNHRRDDESVRQQRRPGGGDFFKQHGVQGFAVHRRDVIKQIGQQQSADDKRQRRAHVNHRAFAGLHARFAQGVQAVADGLDAGVGAGAQTVGAQQDGDQSEPADFCGIRLHVGHNAVGDAGQIAEMRRDRPDDGERVAEHEHEKHRHPEQHGFLGAAQIQQREKHDDAEGKFQFPDLPFHRQHAEQRIRAAGHADGDGQNIIADERAAGHDAGRGRKQLARDEITAAAGGKQFDDLRIARADDDDGQHRGRRDEQAQKSVALQRQKRRLRAVARGGQSVRAQPDPRQQRDQRQVVKQIFIGKIAGAADDRIF